MIFFNIILAFLFIAGVWRFIPFLFMFGFSWLTFCIWSFVGMLIVMPLMGATSGNYILWLFIHCWFFAWSISTFERDLIHKESQRRLKK